MRIQKVLCWIVSMMMTLCIVQGCDMGKKGIFLGPVSNLYYETATLSGYTSEQGEFMYRENETVRFFIGDICLGETMGAEYISLFDLAGITPPTTSIAIREMMNRMVANTNPYPFRFVKKGGTPFERVINSSVFLDTLDQDTNTENGIQIPDAIHKLSKGLTLDFNKQYYDFYDCFALRKLIAQCRAQGLWGSHRAICKPHLALDHLYANLGLTPDVWAVSSIRHDPNADGIVDSIEIKGYDPNGKLNFMGNDQNGDGIIESRSTNGFDENGNFIFGESDWDADGLIDSRSACTFDRNGLMTLDEQDENADGITDARMTYRYDENGSEVLYEEDNDADGVADYCSRFSYDDAGNRTQTEIDSNADGSIDYRAISVFDEKGNETYSQIDTDGDGKFEVNAKMNYVYDNSGNILLKEGDNNGDETTDFRHTDAYNENGYMALSESDYDADGTIDMRLIYSYDENGNQTVREENDGDDDGTIDNITCIVFNDYGNPIL